MIVKELFFTIQGEGANAGRPAVFCRFAGCNLWSGREKDRASAVCKFCDTQFVGGTNYSEAELADGIAALWPGGGKRLCVLTGGEPGLQLTSSLILLLQIRGFDVAVETNGTIKLPDGVYWITVSPKAGTEINQRKGAELKVVWPQDIDLESMKRWDFRRFFLQPMDGLPNAVEQTIDKVRSDPFWSLSIQTHKLVGIR